MLARVRSALVGAVAAGLMFGLGGVALSSSAVAVADSYVAKVTVNVRSGPSTDDTIVGTLAAGASLPAAGAAKDGWQPVTYNGKTCYIKQAFLQLATGATTSSAPSASSPTAQEAAPTITATGPKGSATTLADLNLRSAPSLASTVVTVLPKGTTVSLTGNVTDRFSEVTVAGTARWLSTTYLKASEPAAPASEPVAKGTAIAGMALTLRGSGSNTAPSYGAVPTGALVQLTGLHSGSYSQIEWKGALRWVLTGYLIPQGSTGGLATLPKPTSKRYINASKTPVLADADASSSVIDTIDPPTVLLLTGKTSSGYSQVIYSGALRWVATAKLSTTSTTTSSNSSSSSPAPASPTGSLGSASLDRTNAYAKTIVLEIRTKFPQIKTIYGWRSYSAYSTDHPSGRALDIMIPGYGTAAGKALGDAIALYLQQNHAKYHVHYLIWRQRNWNVERNTSLTAWRAMADRGGITANHYDHVHVSVYSAS